VTAVVVTLGLPDQGVASVFSEGERVKVKNPDGAGWIVAEYRELAESQPKHIDNPGVNDGRGYESDQAWVVYREGDREGTSGLHPIREEIRPEDFEPDSDPAK
jgi:hypothetical protein